MFREHWHVIEFDVNVISTATRPIRFTLSIIDYQKMLPSMLPLNLEQAADNGMMDNYFRISLARENKWGKITPNIDIL